MLPASRLSTEFYNIDWVRGLQARISTIVNEWRLQWPKVYNFEWVESTMLPASRLSTEFYNIDWVRGLQARISTIVNEWCLQWPRVYNFEWVESTLLPTSTLSTEWSQRFKNSTIFTELDNYRDEYLRLLMSGVFNDNKFTVLNVWSKQWYQYQHSRQSGVNNNTKFYNIYWVRGLHARKSTIINEWCLQWPEVYNFE